jgi:hypothetical protein
VPAADVDAVAEREGATPFDTPGAKLGHHNGRCSFETIIDAYHLTEREPALARLADIVHGADVAAELDHAPESRGLKAIAEGFGLVYPDDQAILAAEFPVYDALLAWCARAARQPPPGALATRVAIRLRGRLEAPIHPLGIVAQLRAHSPIPRALGRVVGVIAVARFIVEDRNQEDGRPVVRIAVRNEEVSIPCAASLRPSIAVPFRL